VILDNETPNGGREYGTPSGGNLDAYTAVENTWSHIKAQLPHALRVSLPKDVNDICEFFTKYDKSALEFLIKEANERKDEGHLHFEPLDFNATPPPVNWLVEGMVAQGDFITVVADPGTGKSMIFMSLAIAMVEQHATWLGHKLAPGPHTVAFLDKENPVDEVYRRLQQMSTTDAWKDIHYLSYPKVMVDSPAWDKMVEHLRAVKPSLVVLDSLTRFHSKDENHAGQMGQVFNAFEPICRDIGATLIVLHHTNKVESSDGFKRARGSSDVSAAPDSAMQLILMDEEHQIVKLQNYKPRRGNAFSVRIQIVGGGEVPLRVGRAPDHVAY
jgi:hypothetical protein